MDQSQADTQSPSVALKPCQSLDIFWAPSPSNDLTGTQMPARIFMPERGNKSAITYKEMYTNGQYFFSVVNQPSTNHSNSIVTKISTLFGQENGKFEAIHTRPRLIIFNVAIKLK